MLILNLYFKTMVEPRPEWLIWLDVFQQSERLPFRFPVGTHAWVVCLVPSWGMQSMFLSHRCFSAPLSPFPLSKNKKKIFKKIIEPNVLKFDN